MMTTDLSGSKNDIYAIQQRIASGQNVSRPSDDPALYEAISRWQNDLDGILQYSRNIDRASYELGGVETSLQNALQLLQRGAELAVRGGDATVSTDDRKAMAEEVNSLLESLVGEANHREGGLYRFAGLRSDTPPYATQDNNGDGWIDTVTYQGSLETKRVEVSNGVYVETSIPGSATSSAMAPFQSGTIDLFGSLIQLRDRLANGELLTSAETTTADPATDTLAVSSIYRQGAAVVFDSDGALPGGMTAGATYYAIPVAGGIQLAASLNDARNGIAIDITSAGAGNITVSQASLEELNDGIDHVVHMLSLTGARQEQVAFHKTILGEDESRLRGTLDAYQSLDIAKAMMELSNRNAAYQAALTAATAFLKSPSLVDYL